MSSIVTAVFKATIGLLVNKGRDKAAEKLSEGDVTDQQFRRTLSCQFRNFIHMQKLSEIFSALIQENQDHISFIPGFDKTANRY